jgi:hypothetical protein
MIKRPELGSGKGGLNAHLWVLFVSANRAKEAHVAHCPISSAKRTFRVSGQSSLNARAKVGQRGGGVDVCLEVLRVT